MISRRSISIMIIALAVHSVSAYADDSAKLTAPLKIACIGDSITFGAGIQDRKVNSYPAQLSTMLGENTTVGNFGVSGSTLLKKGDKPYWNQPNYKAALEFKPDVVIIMLGTNDSKPQNWKHKADYTSDYVELIESFRKLESNPTVLICYPVPAYPGRWGITDTVINEEVMPLIDEIASKADIKIIDLYSALSDKKAMFPDTVHPNAAGAKVMAETIAEALTIHNVL